MSNRFTVDMLTEDPQNNEYVVYLVEAGPWDDLRSRLVGLQERLYNAVDLVIDGHLASRYPITQGKRIRIQVDCHDAPPEEVEVFIGRFRQHIASDAEYGQSIRESRFVSHLRIVTGTEMGRGAGDQARG